MNPQKDQHVKCVLRNGAVAEGIVEEWTGSQVQLKSLDGESILIITHPAEDIMLIKIILTTPTVEEIAAELEHEKTELEQRFEETRQVHDPNNPDDRKTLAQLRIELAKQDRKIIAEKLKEHKPTQAPGKTRYHYPGVQTGNYGYPGSGKKPRP